MSGGCQGLSEEAGAFRPLIASVAADDAVGTQPFIPRINKAAMETVCVPPVLIVANLFERGSYCQFFSVRKRPFGPLMFIDEIKQFELWLLSGV
jgi:hypothetical protein